MKTKNLTFCITKETIKKLEVYCEKNMIAKSRLTDRAIVEYIDKKEKIK